MVSNVDDDLGEDFEAECDLLNGLAAAMQRYGVSSHAMETTLGRAARALHVHGEFLATPAQVQSILWKDDASRQRTHISLSKAGDADLTKFVQVSELLGQVEAGQIRPHDGLERLRVIDASASGRPAAIDALAFALCAVGFGVILALPWRDVGLAAALSLVPFALRRGAANSQGLANALDLVAAATVSAMATLLCLAFPGSNPLGVAVCAIIWFVPGFGLTLGANELMVGNTLSGLIGFTNATVTSAKLLAGAVIGTAIVVSRFAIPPPDAGQGIDPVWTWLFAPVLVLGLAILERVRTRDLMWPLVGGLAVWTGVQLGAGIGFWQGTLFGAFILRISSRLITRATRLPDLIILLPAVMLLVPGVATLRAFYAGQTQGLVEGLRAGYQVVVLVAAILGGVLLGEAALSIRRPRFPPLLSTLSHSLRRGFDDTDADAEP